MTKKILIAGFACLSVVAVAQSSGSKDQNASAAKDVHPRDVATGQASGKITAPRDIATGQASGKRQYQPVLIRKVSEDDTNGAREQQSPKAAGKTSASDDWHVTNAKSNGSGSAADVNRDGVAERRSAAASSANGQGRVAAGDVNGDGKADAAINTSHSNIKSPRDMATGQASGKRMHQDITITKYSDTAPQK